MNSRFNVFMPFDPDEETRGRSVGGSSGDLLNARVSITVIVAGGGVSDNFKCGDGAVYCSKCGEGGRAGRRGFQPGDFLGRSVVLLPYGASYSIRDMVSSESEAGEVPSGTGRAMNFGYGAYVSGVRINIGSVARVGVWIWAVSGTTE